MSNNWKIRSAAAILALLSLLNFTVLADIPSDNDGAVVPGGYASWQVMGPDGGDVRVVRIDPRDPQRLYISTLDGQIHTSTDGGHSWHLLVNLNQPELILDQLMIDSRDSKILYTAGHRHKSPGGFFKSTDGGATWKQSKELRQEAVYSLTQSKADPDILLAGTTDGVWISKNSGDDWEKFSSPTNPVNVASVAMDPRNTTTYYAGTWWRPYKTTDGGKNWKLIKDGMIDDSDVFAVTLDPRNPDHIISSACSGIYESTNAGERWAKIQGIPSQSRRTRDILQHPTMPGTIYAATTEGFWMTSNGGKSWALTTRRDLEINSIAVHPDQPNRVFIGTNNYGVMVSNDGGKNFVPTNDNFTSRFTYLVQPDVQQPNRLYAATHNVATGGGFFFTSDDGGRNWNQSRGLDVIRVIPFVLRQEPSNPSNMYLGTNVGLFRSADRGASWTEVKAPPKPRSRSRRPVRRSAAKAPVKRTTSSHVKKTAAVTARRAAPPAPPAAAEPTLIPAIDERIKVLEVIPGPRFGLLAGTDTGLYRTYDLAKGWEKLSFGGSFNDDVSAVHVSAAHPDTIWVGTATSGVIVSHDDGKTWTRTGGAIDNIPVSSIESDPKRPDYIYVGTTQTFYVSRDGGATWNRRGGNLPLGDYTSILINPNNTDEVLVSSSLVTDGGVYLSTDAGNRWKRVDKDLKLPSRRVWSMSFDPTDPDRIFAATHSSGVYRIERPSKSGGAE